MLYKLSLQKRMSQFPLPETGTLMTEDILSTGYIFPLASNIPFDFIHNLY
jgi:hypothetical protein